MSEHTPGPWRACNNYGYSIWRIFASWRTGSKTVAEVVGDSAETEANARLIAAAPEMLELLAEIRDQHLIPRCGINDCDSCDDKLFAARIDALMEKIEGGEGE